MVTLCRAGFLLHKISLEDVTISAHSGRVKIGTALNLKVALTILSGPDFQKAEFVGPCVDSTASPFQRMLANLISCLTLQSSLDKHQDFSNFLGSASHVSYTELQHV